MEACLFMKYSRYNFIIGLSPDFCVAYNALTDCFILLSDRLRKEMEAENPDGLRRRNAYLYEKLVEGGCIVEEEKDETEALKQKIEEIDDNKHSFLLTLNPTLNCNFKCWYCYEQHLKSSRMSKETMRRLFLFMDRTAHPDLHFFSLSFFGGEPLLYAKEVVLPIISYFTELCTRRDISSRISFTSNAYLLNPELIRQLKEYKVSSFQITLDGCREEHNQVRACANGQGSYDRILQNIKELLGNGIQVILRINYTVQNIGRMPEILRDLEDLDEAQKQLLQIDFQRVWQDSTSPRDIKEVTEGVWTAFRDKGFRVTTQHFDHVFNSCYADKKNQAVINYDGNIYKCTARDFTESHKMGFLNEEGEIVWKPGALEQWNRVKLQRSICQECRIAPLCGGGCRQKSVEFQRPDECLMHWDEKRKEEIIYERFLERYIYS